MKQNDLRWRFERLFQSIDFGFERVQSHNLDESLVVDGVGQLALGFTMTECKPLQQVLRSKWLGKAQTKETAEKLHRIRQSQDSYGKQRTLVGC